MQLPLARIDVTAKHSGIRVLLVGLLLLGALVLTWMPNLDMAAQDYLANALSDNLVVYASARAINALISVIQSIEISVSLGAGVAVNLGEMLDPLNDLIERFSGFVLYSLAGLGLQQLALVASSSLFSKALLTIFLVVGFAWWLCGPGQSIPIALRKLLVFFLMLRFVFAVEVGISWMLDKTYFDARQQEAISTLDIARNQLQGIRDQYMEAMEEKGLFKGMWTTAQTIIGSDEQDGIADLAAGAIVQLIVILLIRSILLPLAFIALLAYIFRRVLHE